MSERAIAKNIDEYMSWFPEATQAKLSEIRSIVSSVVPEATETISYAIPTFDLGGKHLVHFAGFEKHVGLYPVIGSVEEAFAEEIAAYRHGRGTLRFPLDQPLPADLIRRIVELMADERRGSA